MPSAGAVIVDDLYVAEVLVNAQDDGQLNSGARAGLLQVLVRVSGSRAVAESPQVRAALAQPQSYFYQYSYESTDRMLQIGEARVPARTLRLTFEPSAIARLLRQSAKHQHGEHRGEGGDAETPELDQPQNHDLPKATPFGGGIHHRQTSNGES